MYCKDSRVKVPVRVQIRIDPQYPLPVEKKSFTSKQIGTVVTTRFEKLRTSNNFLRFWDQNNAL